MHTDPGLFSNGSAGSRRVIYGLVLLIIAAGGVSAVRYVLTDPKVVLLLPGHGAQWILRDEPFDLDEKVNSRTYSVFSTDFVSPTGLRSAVLRVTAVGRVLVVLDGKTLFDTGSKIHDWHIEYQVTIPLDGIAGTVHHLRLPVANLNGPTLVRADCPGLEIFTGPGWKASPDGKIWSDARPADRLWEPALSGQFETTLSDIGRYWPLQILLLLAGRVAWLLAFERSNNPRRWEAFASRIRWGVLAAWGLLAVNNLAKLPTYVGYDTDAHFQYIDFVATNWKIPLPDQGWQYFQTPVYYVLSAVFYKAILMVGTGPDHLPGLLRLVPFVCGGAMVQVCYLAAGAAFPGRGDLRAIAAVVGGLIPVNLYMAQALSNEPLAGIFVALCVVQTVRFIAAPAPKTFKRLVVIGLLLGLAVLTKVSAVIWVPVVALVVAVRLFRDPGGVGRKLGLSSMTPAIVAAVVLPYLVRNRIATGQWVFLNSQVTGFKWWQDPGFRTPAGLLSFGHVLMHPAYNGLGSFWDSIYSTTWGCGLLSGVIDYVHRPPWNYGLMSCGLWLAIVPVLLLMAGGVRAVPRFRPAKSSTQTQVFGFSAAMLTAGLCAVLWVYLTLPIYSCAKGSYLLGAIPCAAILIAGGHDLLSGFPKLRAWSVAFVFTWAVNSYMTYFVL